MRAIDHFNLRNFDLNLLLAFDALMQELSVTLAAERLHIQQPAMSHSLATLRLLLQDPLFVRSGSHMEPTPRAKALGAVVRRILHDAQEALLVRETFEPARWRGSFRIGVNVQLESLLIPDLLRCLREEAPQVRLVTSGVNRQTVFDQIDQGSIDLAAGYLPGGLSWHMRSRLFDEAHVCCYSRSMIGRRPPITVEEYATLPHGLVSNKNDAMGYLEDAFERAGIQPQVVLSSPNAMTLALAAAETPMLVTMTERLARRHARRFKLDVSPLPIALTLLPVDMIWHARLQDDPAHAWLRQRISERLALL